MREITVFEAKDGTTHKTKQEAYIHEAAIDFREWYNNGRVIYPSDLYLEAGEIMEWLIKNKLYVEQFLKDIPIKA
jgi:hypothetical protein